MSAIISPPSFHSPSFGSTPTSMSSAGVSRRASVLPLQQTVSSASQIPPSTRSNSTTTSPYTPNQYIEQHRKFMEHQRQLHEEERALWGLERRELHHRIHELEDMVRRLGGHPKSTFSLPNSQLDTSKIPGMPSIPSSVTGGASFSSSYLENSAGNEFWRGAGGKSDAHPTRSFSESSDPSRIAATTIHLPSIIEDPGSRRKSVGFVGVESEVSSPPVKDFHTHPIPGHSSHAISSIPGDRISASLDGISFKPSSAVAKAISSNSATPSPLGTPASHAAVSSAATSAPPSAIPKPVLLDLPATGLTEEDLLKKHAGHTPLAKLAGSESNASSQDTPLGKPLEAQQQNFEAEPLQSRQPLEYSDSYFPTKENQPPEIAAEDPALREPLNLKGDPDSRENVQFLDQLDSKLLQAQRSSSLDASSETSEQGTDLRKVRSADGDRPISRDGPSGDNEELEPTLRMKRSTNFGSRFGASTLGQGV